MSAPNRCTKEDIESWLLEILPDIEIHKVNISGLSEKGDGYLGDITFVEVHGKDCSGGEKKFDFVVKHGKPSKQLREKMPVRCAFENEIYVYETILPEFAKFQKERNVKVPFNNTPKCYGTLVFEEMEVLFLENLKTSGYVLHERRKPMNFEHVSSIIKLYGKLHAISYALRDQKPELFQDLSGKLIDVMREFGKMEAPQEVKIYQDVIEIAEKQNEHEIVKRLSEYQEIAFNTYNDLTDPSDPYAVILHGDCWNNNFMFKYEDDDHKIPSDICFIDWQISRLASPVFDLSYFLFTCLSYDDVHRFDEINAIYYESLCAFLRELGSDPGKLFPFEELQRQWIKFSKFGLIMMPSIIRLVLSEKEEVPDVTEHAEAGSDFTDTFLYKVKNSEEYGKRTLSVMKLAVEREFI